MFANPRAVPRVEKKSLIKNASMKAMYSGRRAPSTSALKATLPRDESAPLVKMLSGNFTTPMIRPRTVVMMIPSKMAPRIL